MMNWLTAEQSRLWHFFFLEANIFLGAPQIAKHYTTVVAAPAQSPEGTPQSKLC